MNTNTFRISPAVLGFLRGLGVIILFSVLSYLADASHLNGVVSTGAAGTIASLALLIEHLIENKNGKALFGSVSVQR